MPFVDTNVLLYLVSGDRGESAKQEKAAEILEREDLFLSVQVLQEFYVQATRLGRSDALTHEEAVELIESWKRYPVQELTVGILDRALAAKVRWQLSYWDAAILEAAREMECEELWSEDLADGQDYGGVRVVNPFA
ncbi:PIN domain-containing protein [Haloferula sp. A504]|uniref:PIN domain-containing protein n=1 Tax=Haloferula sp. A504 TaxID=3373601 RepID=UPI0037C1720A